ncbi:MAG: hypothetical protein M1818_002048 [Claussenomyces sp. TS43310]|nr:MAG: hypothetical protein M1818_002048 [Claussenomyces sp. TS43310]
MAASRPPTPDPAQLPPVPASPTYSYASTANPVSAFNLPLPPPPRAAHAVLTKTDLEASQTAYAELLTTAKQYRLALAELSTAASAFGSALESCARLKEARSEALRPSGGSISNSFAGSRGACTADSLLAASGVHQLVANHQQILSETVYRSFEVPLLHELDGWRRRMEEEEVAYQRDVKERSKEIRKMEKEGLKLHRSRKRDVAKFRGHLVELTTKLDELTSLHGGHSRSLLSDCQETSGKIVEASSSLVRAEVDIFEALAKKGWSGGGLDELLEKGTDLFANDDDFGHSGSVDTSKLFSILPQKSILADSDSGRPGHVRNDSLLVEGEQYQSLAGAVERGGDSASVFSERATEGNFNRSRGVRPFSPPPLRRAREPQEPSEAPVSIAEAVSSISEAQVKPREGEAEGGSPKVTRPSLADGERGRERRWSVTDDGGLSE